MAGEPAQRYTYAPIRDVLMLCTGHLQSPSPCARRARPAYKDEGNYIAYEDDLPQDALLESLPKGRVAFLATCIGAAR